MKNIVNKVISTAVSAALVFSFTPTAAFAAARATSQQSSELAEQQLPAEVNQPENAPDSSIQGQSDNEASGSNDPNPADVEPASNDSSSAQLGSSTTPEATGQPAPTITYSLDDAGDATVTGYSGQAASLTIPSEIDGHPVVAVGGSAFDGASWLESVELPAGLASVGSFAFRGTSISTLDVPEGTKTLEYSSFAECATLESVSLPSTLGSFPDAFTNCSALASVTLAEGIETVDSSAFYGCRSLASVELPTTLKGIGDHAFYHTALASVMLPDGAEWVGPNAFQSCSSLASVTLPSSVRSVAPDAFKSLPSGSEIRVGSWELYYRLSGNTTVLNPEKTTVVRPDGDEPAASFTYSLDDAGDATVNGYSGQAASLTIPSEIDGHPVVAVGGSAFDGASWLESVELLMPI